MSTVSDCRLIVDPPAPGWWNMAVDEALLVDAVENGVATLRFYQWSEPTLSLGYFQHYEDRRQHPASCECAVVRRQTGGGAIMHDRELTYSLALPAGHALSKNTDRLYAAVHEAFITVLRPTIAGDSPWTLHRRQQTCDSAVNREPFLCFQRRACGDVLLRGRREVSNSLGREHDLAAEVSEFKVLGSAQRRRRGAVLQHGSLLLERSPAAPELAGWRDLTGAEAPVDGLVRGLAAELQSTLRIEPVQATISPQLESSAADLAKNKYATAGWTKRH